MSDALTIHADPDGMRINGVSRELAASGHGLRVVFSQKVPGEWMEQYGDEWREFVFRTPKQRAEFLEALYGLFNAVTEK